MKLVRADVSRAVPYNKKGNGITKLFGLISLFAYVTMSATNYILPETASFAAKLFLEECSWWQTWSYVKREMRPNNLVMPFPFLLHGTALDTSALTKLHEDGEGPVKL